jgi:hypothetical protein
MNARGRDRLVDAIAVEVTGLVARVKRLEEIFESGAQFALELAEFRVELDLARDEQRAINQLLAAQRGGVLVPAPPPKARGRRPRLVVDNTENGGPHDADS